MAGEIDYQNGIKSPKAAGLFAYDESTGNFIPVKVTPDGAALVRDPGLAPSAYGAIYPSEKGAVQKCELCLERETGIPACVSGCPNGAIVFEERDPE